MESSKFENRLFIDGEFRIPESDKKFELFNPATTERVASVYEAGAEEVNLAVKAAVQAFDSWSAVGAAERSRWLNRFADKLEENVGELSRLEALTMGRPTHNDFVRKRGISIILVLRKLTPPFNVRQSPGASACCDTLRARPWMFMAKHP